MMGEFASASSVIISLITRITFAGTMLMRGQDEVYDALIIGAGPAGLSTAGHLVRSAFSAIVFDSGRYRNALAPSVHGIPGWDQESPTTIRDRMKSDLLDRYSEYITIEEAEIEAVKNVSKPGRSLFVATNTKGREWRGRKVVLATGVSDLLPTQTILGYDACWVKGIYQCLTSQGFEKKWSQESALPSSAGVLAVGDCAAVPPCIRLAAQAKQIVPQVRIYTHGDEALSTQIERTIRDTKTAHVLVERRKIARLYLTEATGIDPEEGAITICFSDGTQQQESFLIHKPSMKVNGTFSEQLGLKMVSHFGHDIIHAQPPFNETSVPGVFAVGDCSSPQKVYAQALAMGACTAAGLGGQLLLEGA